MRNEFETQGEHGDVPTLGKQGKAVPRGAPTSGEVRMAKVIVVTSGKGGVGKTTTSASIAAGMAMQGFKTVAIAGTYTVLEDIPPALRGKPVQVRLDTGPLRIEELA